MKARPVIFTFFAIAYLIGGIIANSQEFIAKGILYSTTYSPSGNPSDKAVHPFLIKVQGEKWFIRVEDEGVLTGSKLGPDYMESAFDGSSVFTTLFFSTQSQERMRNDPRLQRLIQKSPVLAKAQQEAAEQLAKADPLFRPLNTNNLSGYVDPGNYPSRLSFAGRSLWLGLIMARNGALVPGYIPNIFEEGQRPMLLRVEQVGGGLILTETNKVAAKNKASPVELKIDSTVTMSDTVFIRSFSLNKFYAETSHPTALFHSCQVSNLNYEITNFSKSLLPALDSKSYIEDRRVLNGKVVRYVETNGHFMVPGSAQSKLQLEQINKVMALRNKRRSMSKVSAIGVAVIVFVPIGLITLMVAKRKKKTT